jgi:hypothetical protein
MLSDPERKSAKCADSQEEADDIAEPSPYLQDGERDAAEDGIQPCDDSRHGRLRGVATLAPRCRVNIPGNRLLSAASVKTLRKCRRLTADI